MAITTDNQANLAFKHLNGKSMTDPGKVIGGEANGISLNSKASDVWYDSINVSPSQAVIDGTAISVTADLVYDSTSNGHSYFAKFQDNTYSSYGFHTGDVVKNAIPPSFGSGYEGIPYDNTAARISVGDPRDWFYQYNSGIFFQQTISGTTPTTITLYVYVGITVADMSTGISNVVEDLSPQAGGNFDMNGHRLLESKGTQTTAINSLILPTDGNTFIITGNTQINSIDSSDWTEGSEITLQFSGTPTIANNHAATGSFLPIILNSASDYTVVVDSVLVLRLIEGQWIEINGLTKISSVPAPYIYVDSINGDDTKGSYSFPFKTLEAASTAATSGNMIWVRKGTYTPVTTISKNGVDWYFDNDVFVNIGSIILFNDTGSDLNVSGKGTFNLASNSAGQFCNITSLVSVYVEFKDIVSINNNVVIYIPNGIDSGKVLNIKGNSIITIGPAIVVDTKADTISIDVSSILSSSYNYAIDLNMANLTTGSLNINTEILSGLKFINSCFTDIKSNLISILEFTTNNSSYSTIVKSNIETLTLGLTSCYNPLIIGNITTLNISDYSATVIGNINTLNQSGGDLYLKGTITTTFNKTSGVFYGNALGSDYFVSQSTEKFNIGDSSNNTSKLNIKSTGTLNPFSVYDTSDNEVFSILNTAVVKLKEISIDPTQITNFLLLYSDTLGKYYAKNDNGIKSWLNAIKNHTPSAGDILVATGTDGYINQQTSEFDLIIQQSSVNINTTGLIQSYVPAGYQIFSIVFEEISNASAGTIRLGTSSNGDEVVGDTSVSASFDDSVIISKGYFSKTNDTVLYITSNSWGSGMVNIHFTYIKTKNT